MAADPALSAFQSRTAARLLPGGHAGKAFWFSRNSGEFVTSTYYYDDYPAWVKPWNAAKPADVFKGTSRELLNDRSTCVHGQMDDRPYEADLKPSSGSVGKVLTGILR